MQIDRYKIANGGLKLEKSSLGSLAHDKVRVRHTHIEMNFYDVDLVRGLVKDQSVEIPGISAIGLVEDVGGASETSGWKLGDAVGYCTAKGGSYSTMRDVAPELLVKIPENLERLKAAALLRTGMMSNMLLRRVYMAPAGAKILIFNPTGGLGHIFLQFAKSLGVRVCAAVDRNISLPSASGCEAVFDSEAPDLVSQLMNWSGGEGLNTVVDTIGGKNLSKVLEAMQYCGLFVSLGQNSGNHLNVSMQRAMRRSIFITRPSLFSYKSSKHELRISWLDIVETFLSNGMELKIQTHAFSDIPKVHDMYVSRKAQFSNIVAL